MAQIYERGLELFSYPVAFELWNLYLTKAVERRMDLERLRDLFEQAIDGCPAKFCKVLYLMYGNLEEERGLARHAMRIYDRASREVSDEDRVDVFTFYITKAAANFGLTATRPIYERAVELLPDKEAKDMCIKFAEMERRLGEIDRARAIYGHASQFCDPRTNPNYWAMWEAFEVQHGNEDTFKEMLRIKRSVQAQYKYVMSLPRRWPNSRLLATSLTIYRSCFSTDINFVASQAISRIQAQATDGGDGDTEIPDAPNDGRADAMAALERQARAPQGFVAASTGPQGGTLPSANKQGEVPAAGVTNPDAIDLDDMAD